MLQNCEHVVIAPTLQCVPVQKKDPRVCWLARLVRSLSSLPMIELVLKGKKKKEMEGT